MQMNDELQDKWRNVIHNSCLVYGTLDHLVERLHEAMEVLKELFRAFIDRLSEVFAPIIKDLKEVFDSVREECYREDNSYPQTYPQYVYNSVRVDTKGFPQKIQRCARSRC